MPDRDDLLGDWVDQPPAPPAVQYLRDAERRAAVDALAPSPDDAVLDLGSEAAVTRALADRGAAVTRVDFAPAASERASEALADAGVEAFAVTEPEAPTLPFDRDRFDAAVSVGPFDWRFLDADRLTRAASRVVAPGGRFVATAPTPRSPYHAGGRYRLHYPTPDEFEATLAPVWELADRTYLYQFTPKGQWLAESLPAPLQRLPVAYAERRNRDLDRDDASYVVLAGRQPGYREAGRAAVDCLLRPVGENGFFDPGTDRFHGRLDYDLDGETPTWTPGEGSRRRYGPMALLGLLRWRATVGDDRRDARVRRLLAGYAALVEESLDELPSYAVGPLTGAFALADGVEGLGDRLDRARALFDHGRDRFAFDHSEDALLLHGWTFLHDALGADGAATDEVTVAIRDAVQRLAARQDAETGLFAFGNATTLRHQNQMYALWGLCRAVETVANDGYLENAAAVLSYTLRERLRPDGGVRWFEPGRRERLGSKLGRGEFPQWTLLFACHQTFLVVAAARYRAAGGTDAPLPVDLDRAVERATRWLHGNNDLGRDLVALSGLGVPMRHLTTDGRLDAPRQQFKGAYEVGAYLLALADLATW